MHLPHTSAVYIYTWYGLIKIAQNTTMKHTNQPRPRHRETSSTSPRKNHTIQMMMMTTCEWTVCPWENRQFYAAIQHTTSNPFNQISTMSGLGRRGARDGRNERHRTLPKSSNLIYVDVVFVHFGTWYEQQVLQQFIFIRNMNLQYVERLYLF